MFLKTSYILTGILAFVYVSQSCKKTSQSAVLPDAPTLNVPSVQVLNLPVTFFNYAAQPLPAHMLAAPVRNTDNNPQDNPVTNAGATLGRVLFYDANLSLNKTISCSSCHKQANGFADALPMSKGFNGGVTDRNSMSLANARYYQDGRFFWDERAATLEVQVLTPIQNAVEMGLTLPELNTCLKTLSYYPALFKDAFGDETITSDRVSKALSQFIRSIVSYRSKYDAGRASVNNVNASFPNFTAEENLGKDLFLAPGSCSSCHGTDAFNAPGLRNNGLDATVTDGGAGAVNNNRADIGRFKVPSLKNIAVTAPYMHDGRFKTLDEVIEHYSTGVKNNPALSPPLRAQGGGVHLLNLSTAEKNALKAFLVTLTDSPMLTDEKFSSPFNINRN
jgi:cytochrome c peroxidase